MIDIEEKDLLDIIESLTTIPDEEGNKLPNYCFASDLTMDLDCSEEELVKFVLNHDYKVYKVFPGETMLGGYAIVPINGTITPVEKMYDEFYGEVPEISEVKLDKDDSIVVLDESKKKSKKKVTARDPNAQAMWGRTRSQTFKPKKGKGSFKRVKHEELINEELRFVNKGPFILSLYDDNKEVGVAYYSQSGYACNFYISPNRRNQGLGKILFDELLKRGVYWFHIEEPNQGAKRFYERYGFIELDLTRDDYCKLYCKRDCVDKFNNLYNTYHGDLERMVGGVLGNAVAQTIDLLNRGIQRPRFEHGLMTDSFKNYSKCASLNEDLEIDAVSMTDFKNKKNSDEYKKKFEHDAEIWGATIKWNTDIYPEREIAFWYGEDGYVCRIHYKGLIFEVYSDGWAKFIDGDSGEEIFTVEEAEEHGYFTDNDLDSSEVEWDEDDWFYIYITKENEDGSGDEGISVFSDLDYDPAYTLSEILNLDKICGDIYEDAKGHFDINEELDLDLLDTSPSVLNQNEVRDFQKEFEESAAEIGATIVWKEAIHPSRKFAFWYDYVCDIHYRGIVAQIKSTGDSEIEIDDVDGTIDIHSVEEAIKYGICTDHELYSDEVCWDRFAKFRTIIYPKDNPKYVIDTCIDLNYSYDKDLYQALYFPFFRGAYEEIVGCIEDKYRDDEIIVDDSTMNEKLDKNYLKLLAKKHKKTDKKGAMGWWKGSHPHGATLNKNAGNVEANVAHFNMTMGAQADGGIGAVGSSGGCCEDLDIDVMEVKNPPNVRFEAHHREEFLQHPYGYGSRRNWAEFKCPSNGKQFFKDDFEKYLLCDNAKNELTKFFKEHPRCKYCVLLAFDKRTNKRVDAKSIFGYNLTEDIEKHETLNPVLFDENNKLLPEVREKLLEIAKEFTDSLEKDEIKFKLKDIKIVGSNCSYNYNKNSDIDLHLVMDTKSLKCPDNLYPLLYSAYRSLFNGKLDPTIKGIPVEIFVETDDTEQLNDETVAESLNEEITEENSFELNKSEKDYYISLMEDDDVIKDLKRGKKFRWILTTDPDYDLYGELDDGFDYVLVINGSPYDVVTKEFVDEMFKECGTYREFNIDKELELEDDSNFDVA